MTAIMSSFDVTPSGGTGKGWRNQHKIGMVLRMKPLTGSIMLSGAKHRALPGIPDKWLVPVRMAFPAALRDVVSRENTQRKHVVISVDGTMVQKRRHMTVCGRA